MAEQNIRICHICGSENDLKSEYCTGCGALLDNNNLKFERTDTIESGVHNVRDVKREKSERKSGKKLSNLKIFYIGLTLLLLGFFVLYGSGVFNQPAAGNVESFSGQSEDPHNGIDMSSLKEINRLQEIVNSNPADYDSMLKLAHLLNDSGFYQKAIEYYGQYLKAIPDNADVHVDMGVCYFELGDYDNAVGKMKTAISYVPNHQIAHFNLGIVNFAFEKHDEAIGWWKKAIEIDPSTQVAKKAQELINNH